MRHASSISLPTTDYGRSRVGSLALPFLMAYAVVCAASAAAADWPMWRCDEKRAAASPADLSATSLNLQWVRDLGEPDPAWLDQAWLRYDDSYEPVVAGSTIFVPSMVTDSVTAYATADGSEFWTYRTDGPVRFAPVVSGGNVYFASDDGYLYCVSAASGALQWKFRAGPSDRKILGNRRLISAWPARGGPVIAGGVLYFAAGIWPFEGVFVYALNPSNGSVVWANTGAGAAPAAWDNQIDLGVRGVGPFAADVTGLTENATYYFRCYAQNSAGGAWASPTYSFFTTDTPPPTGGGSSGISCGARAPSTEAPLAAALALLAALVVVARSASAADRSRR